MDRGEQTAHSYRLSCNDPEWVCWQSFRKEHNLSDLQSRWVEFRKANNARIYWDNKARCFRLAGQKTRKQTFFTTRWRNIAPTLITDLANHEIGRRFPWKPLVLCAIALFAMGAASASDCIVHTPLWSRKTDSV